MIIVTGGAGFIGSNLIHQLNRTGERNILLVDSFAPASNLSRPKFLNLAGAEYADYMDKREFRAALKAGYFEATRIRAILLPANERPLNIYGYSKMLFDNYVRSHLHDMKCTVVGLRYFNVYGPREQHKGRMASVIQHFAQQLKDSGTIRMFEGSGGYGGGEQRRDFVFVEDIVRMNMFFAGLLPDAPRKPIHAVVNAGTGEARTFKDVAGALMKVCGRGKMEYIPFPEDLKNRYQNYTQADLSGLRATGYASPFTSLEDGVQQTFAN